MQKRASLAITEDEYRARAARLLDYVREQHLSGAVLFDNYYILYYTGFAFIPTERPMAFAISAGGEKLLFVPRLELEHAHANALADRVEHYVEYPGTTHPMEALKGILAEMGVAGHGQTVGADVDGYPWILGYRGPSLSESAGVQVQRLGGFVEDQMAVKSPAELTLIRESIRWANLAHTLLQRYTHTGATETAVSLRATAEATLAMLDAIGPIYRAQSAFSDGPSAGYRGQIGRGAAIPHALAGNVTFRAGDVLVTGAGAPVWGYNSELERTMILGPASSEQKRMFDHMLALQETALNAIAPGATCADVDRAVRAYFEAHDLTPFWKHHSGHAIGFRYHEGPFLDTADATVLRPGMVFTVEPGLYVPGLGGFRHSDTVVVTDDGIEIMTYYPRDLESLTLPV